MDLKEQVWPCCWPLREDHAWVLAPTRGCLHPRRSTPALPTAGLGHHQADFRLHQPHGAPRSPGALAGGPGGEAAPQTPADHLRDQPETPGCKCLGTAQEPSPERGTGGGKGCAVGIRGTHKPMMLGLWPGGSGCCFGRLVCRKSPSHRSVGILQLVAILKTSPIAYQLTCWHFFAP